MKLRIARKVIRRAYAFYQPGARLGRGPDYSARTLARASVRHAKARRTSLRRHLVSMTPAGRLEAKLYRDIERGEDRHP